MKKAGIITGIFLILLMGIVSVNFVSKKNVAPTTKAKVNYEAANFDNLIRDSQYVVEAIATDQVKSINYKSMNFVQTKLELKKIYKNSSVVANNEIWLLQSVIVEDPIVSKGDRLLLFLDKYSGPVTNDDAYVFKGLYQGHYKISNNQLIPSAKLSEKLNADFEQVKSYDKMINKVKGN